MDNFVKITTGWVEQSYERNKEGMFVCIKQEFKAGDLVEFEDDYRVNIPPQVNEYFPYNMVQPKGGE